MDLSAAVSGAAGRELRDVRDEVVARTVLEAAPAPRSTSPRPERVSLHAVTMVPARGARIVLD